MKLMVLAPDTQLSKPWVHFVGLATVKDLPKLLARNPFFMQDFVHYSLPIRAVWTLSVIESIRWKGTK